MITMKIIVFGNVMTDDFETHIPRSSRENSRSYMVEMVTTVSSERPISHYPITRNHIREESDIRYKLFKSICKLFSNKKVNF